MKLKKFCLVLSLIAVFLFTGLIAGPGLVFADDESDWDQIISDVADLQASLGNLTPEQVENAVDLLEEAVKSLWGDDDHTAILSQEQQTCLEITLGLNYSDAKNPVDSFRTYINSHTSNSLTGYEGFIDALQTDNITYLMPLCQTLYDAYGTPVSNKLDEHGITVGEMADIIAELAKVEFAPGLEFTPAVSDQFQDILDKIVDESDDLTDGDLDCSGLTVLMFENLLNRLKDFDGDGLEDILDAMGNVEQDNEVVAPTVQTVAASAVTTDSATLNGNITNTGGENCDQRKFQYREVSAADWMDAGFETSGPYGTGPFSFNMTGLDSNTDYEFKAMARNSKGWNSGDILSFTTAAPQGDYIIDVDTDKPSYSHGESVNVTGTLKQNNQEQTPVENVSIGLQLLKDNLHTVAQVITDADGVFTWQIPTGWLASGSYTVFATANVVSDETNFIITTVTPTVQTYAATNITSTSVTLNGNINNTGGENCTVRKFVYGLQGAVDWTDAGVENGSFGTGDFSFALTGLAPGTDYEFKAMAQNPAGPGEGEVVAFTTSEGGGEVTAPTVTTGSATGISTSGATLNGNITNTGGENCDQRKFQYRQQGTTTWIDAGLVSGSFGTGTFSFALTGLTSLTTYEVKAMAHNSSGWGEGTVVTFTTLKSSSGGGGGGGGGGSTCVLDVDTYMPAANAENITLDTVVKITFKQNIAAVDLTKVSIKDALNNVVSGVKATVDGKVLNIAHDTFAYNTKYTVSVPYGTVKRSDCTTNNSSLSWSFTTAKETILPPACVYSDVPDSYWAAGVIKELCEKGILNGYPDGTFRPRNDITRAEFAKIMVVALGLAEENPATPTFSDVAPGDWYYGVVEAAAKAGLVKGYGNGLFKPNAKISRQEIAAILVRALGKQDEAAANANTMTSFKDDNDIASWARGSVVVAFNEGLIKGYPNGTFGPKKNAIRAEVCAMVSRMLAKL